MALTIGSRGPRVIARSVGRWLKWWKAIWNPKRNVILEFESTQCFKEWLNCEEHREPRKMRYRTALTNMIVVGGFSSEIAGGMTTRRADKKPRGYNPAIDGAVSRGENRSGGLE